jgi:hypothetical protein
MQPHYPGMGRGLARNLFALVWGTSQLYKGTQYPRIRVVASGGQQCSRPANRLPARKTLWVSRRGTGVTLDMEVDCQGVPVRYILHRVGHCTKEDKRKALIGCLSWHRMLCGDDAHTMSIRMVWVKCTTSAECKSIRISRFLGHGWLERSIHCQMQFWF